MKKSVDVLKGYLDDYKALKLSDRVRVFFENHDMENIKELISEVKLNSIQRQELSTLDNYYMNELLLTYEYFKYLMSLIKQYKINGFNKKLEEDYITFADENSNKIEFYLAKQLLTSAEQTALRELSNNNLVNKNYYDERIDLLLNMYRIKPFYSEITEDELYNLSQHLYLHNIVFSIAMNHYKEYTTEKNKIDVIKMYREVFAIHSDSNSFAIEILESTDHISLAKKYIDNGIDIKKMVSIIGTAKASVVFSMTLEEIAIINKFLSIFRDEYRKLNPIEAKEEIIEKSKGDSISYEEAKRVMQEYESSIYKTKVAFRKSKGYTSEYFKACEEIFLGGKNKKYKFEKTEVEKICDKIQTSLENGIVVDNQKRSFDIIDYYEITKISPEDLIEELEKRDIKTNKPKYKETHSIIVTKKYLADKDENYNVMTSMKITYNVKFNRFGDPILNTGTTITAAESLKCVEYLKEKDIPVTTLTYPAAIKRYIKGYISFDEKVKVK